MAATLTTDKTTYSYLDPITFTLTGGPLNTACVALVTDANGQLYTYNFTTDGSGNATFSDVVQTAGTFSAQVTTNAPTVIATSSSETGVT